MPLRGVIFDMGGTLLDYHPPGAGWRGMEDLGAAGVYTFLKKQGYPLPPHQVALDTNFEIVSRHWRRVAQGEPVNPTLADILVEVITAWGMPQAHRSDGLLDGAVQAYVAAVQPFVRPLDGGQQVLAALHARGLRLGLVSNTVWPGITHRADLERWGLATYLEVMLFSADEGLWKPGAAIFNRALRALELQPGEAAYVGDSLYFDVYGAQQAGLKAIWVENQEMTAPLSMTITPDAVIRRLSDLPDAIASWL